MVLKKRMHLFFLAAVVMVLGLLAAGTVHAGTLYESDYVSFSPDDFAWTIREILPYAYYLEYFEKNEVMPFFWYEKGERVETGIVSALQELEQGQHYYDRKRRGEIPIGYWEVQHARAGCIHDDCKAPEWHGVENKGVEGSGNPCVKAYYSGWFAYCADCGQQITSALVYMSRNAAASLTSLDVDKGYYYQCPFCFHIENTMGVESHECRGVSWNQYKVKYDANTGMDTPGGYMEKSLHMYNNASEYEGQEVTPVTHLTPNAYTCTGYVFAGWNTEPDGSGKSFGDGQEIYNLSVADCKDSDTWTAEDNGTVILYAQWTPSESTLVIDGNGGSYDGEASRMIVEKYGSRYVLDGTIVPPAGYTVTFEENGGSSVEDVVSTMLFTDWTCVEGFRGMVKNGVYHFLAPDGHTDVLRANYKPGEVKLPETVRENSSFGGWYYDAEFTRPAGGAGDTIMPMEDITLYASWVELLLTSTENDTANDGKGAVDLNWKQPDGQNKTYMIYQSRDGKNWNQITSAQDIGKPSDVSESFYYSENGREGTYTVPYSGIYTLTAYGAQGGSCGSYPGGLGGEITAKVWLKKGEKLSYTIGGQDGYHGGGVGTKYGGGGGSTVVASDLKGVLLVAGGGGGASENGAGGSGGANTGLRGDGSSEGESGQSGGGAGYAGGRAGEYIVHRHTQECYLETDLSYTFRDLNDDTVWTQWGGYTEQKVISSGHIYLYGHTNGGMDGKLYVNVGSAEHPIPTKGNTRVSIPMYFESWGDKGCILEGAYLKIFDQSGRELKSLNMAEQYTAVYENKGSDHYEIGTEETPFVVEAGLSEQTTGIYMALALPISKGSSGVGSWITLSMDGFSFSGGREYEVICGYQEGQVLTSTPAYGGSSYAAPSGVLEYDEKPGTRKGNGEFRIQSQVLGFVEEHSMDGVAASDCAAPDAIGLSTVKKEAQDESCVRISWDAPEDYGTLYYHVAESYLAGSSSRLSVSNITRNLLTSGVTGYYYLLDGRARTQVSIKKAQEAATGRGGFVTQETLTVAVRDSVQYLHIAAVDRAGNLSTTIHVPISAETINWALHTGQLVMEETVAGEQVDNVYPAVQDKTWYVRADGETPFTLTNSAYLEGTATEKYQPNYTIYESVADGVTARNVIHTPSHEIKGEEIRTDASGLVQTMEGQSVLSTYPYSYTVKSEDCRGLIGVQKFTLAPEMSGKRIRVIPIAGADRDGEIIYSSHEEDEGHGLTLIGDGEGPVITGLELLENTELINRNDGTIVLNVTASDALSGVGELYLEITNLDHYGKQVYYPDENGVIRVELTKEISLFSGDFMVTAYSRDRVGNETQVSHTTTEFTLTTKVERILEPHDPVFKCGESGILTITTWGYADRVEVEFPEEFTRLNPNMNLTFSYKNAALYRNTEEVQFMVPLGVEENKQYQITVRAYKGERMLDECPIISAVGGGNILEEIRTRLR